MSKKIKTYTPEEAAILVLKKTEELYKNSSLSKSNSSHEVETGEEASNDEAECPEYLASADIESGSSTGKHGEAKSSESDVEFSEEDKDMEFSEEDKDKKKKKVPEHEEGMGEEEKEIHDETESDSDEEEVVSDKKVESQEKDEADSDKIEDKEEDKKEDKKFPFQKAEKLNNFMQKMELKKKFKINKNAKIEKFLGTDKKVIKPTESMAPKKPSIPQPKGNESGDKPMHKPTLAPVANKLKPKAGY